MLSYYTRPLSAHIYTGGEDKNLYINSLLLGTCRMQLCGHTQRISGIATYMGGPQYPSCVISSSWDETIRIWKVDDCFLEAKNTVATVSDSWRTLKGHTNRICSVKVFLVHPSHKKGARNPAAEDASEDDEGSYPMIASGSTDGSIKIWNFQYLGNNEFNTDCLFTIFDELNITWYLCLEFIYTRQDGHLLVSGSKDNFVRVRREGNGIVCDASV